MKKILLSLLVVGVGVFVTSCGKDDEEKKSNYVIHDGVEYELSTSSAEIYDYGCGTTHCNYDFYFYGIGETYVEVYVELYEESTSGFSGGNFSNGLDSQDVSYWDDDYVQIGDVYNYAASGSVKATPLSGTNEWKIDFNYTDGNGKSYKGNYTGELTLYDNSNARSVKD